MHDINSRISSNQQMFIIWTVTLMIDTTFDLDLLYS